MVFSESQLESLKESSMVSLCFNLANYSDKEMCEVLFGLDYLTLDTIVNFQHYTVG